MAAKIAPGRATISMKLRTSTISIDLTGASLPEKTALLAYRFTVGASSRAERDVLNELARQQSEEGYTEEGDDQYNAMELSYAAGCYVRSAQLCGLQDVSAVPISWPWPAHTYKPKSVREDLVRAAALLLAEINRFDRLGKHIAQQAAKDAEAS